MMPTWASPVHLVSSTVRLVHLGRALGLLDRPGGASAKASLIRPVGLALSPWTKLVLRVILVMYLSGWAPARVSGSPALFSNWTENSLIPKVAKSLSLPRRVPLEFSKTK